MKALLLALILTIGLTALPQEAAAQSEQEPLSYGTIYCKWTLCREQEDLIESIAAQHILAEAGCAGPYWTSDCLMSDGDWYSINIYVMNYQDCDKAHWTFKGQIRILPIQGAPGYYKVDFDDATKVTTHHCDYPLHGCTTGPDL